MSDEQIFAEAARALGDDMWVHSPTVERPWKRWDRFVFAVTGRASKRVYRERMAGLVADEVRLVRWRVERSRL